MSLLPFFTWCEKSVIGEAIRNSQWLFPVIESVHLLALVLIAGAVLVVDMRLFGLGLRRQPVAQLARDAQPWLIGGLTVMLSTGMLLFLAEAIKCYYSPAFAVKMTSLLLALIFTFTVHRKVVLADESRVGALWSRVVAVVSVALWSGVGIGGRWIGFS
jgi:putative flippase GtrA